MEDDAVSAKGLAGFTPKLTREFMVAPVVHGLFCFCFACPEVLTKGHAFGDLRVWKKKAGFMGPRLPYLGPMNPAP